MLLAGSSACDVGVSHFFRTYVDRMARLTVLGAIGRRLILTVNFSAKPEIDIYPGKVTERAA